MYYLMGESFSWKRVFLGRIKNGIEEQKPRESIYQMDYGPLSHELWPRRCFQQQVPTNLDRLCVCVCVLLLIIYAYICLIT